MSNTANAGLSSGQPGTNTGAIAKPEDAKDFYILVQQLTNAEQVRVRAHASLLFLVFK